MKNSSTKPFDRTQGKLTTKQKTDPGNVVLVIEFKEYLKIKNYSEASIKTYWHNIINFLIWTEEVLDKRVKEITKDHIAQYHKHLTDKNYSPSSVQRNMYSLKRFFAWLEEKTYILINPMEDMVMGRVKQSIPVVLTEKEINKILDQPNTSRMYGIRDKAILEVFYSTGIRLSELINLTIFDIDTQAGFLRVNKGKFSKDRFTPLTKAAIWWLKEYINKVRKRLTKKYPKQQTLFLSIQGNKMTPGTISALIRNYTKQAGIKKKVTAHTFRHTFATHLLENGADIFKVQKLLGHVWASTTQRYTKVHPKRIKDQHKTYHPREADKE